MGAELSEFEVCDIDVLAVTESRPPQPARPSRSRCPPGPTRTPSIDTVRGAAWPDRSPRRRGPRDTATSHRSTPTPHRRGPAGSRRSHGYADADPRTATSHADMP